MKYLFILMMICSTAFASIYNSMDAGFSWIAGNNSYLVIQGQEKFIWKNENHRIDFNAKYLLNKKYSTIDSHWIDTKFKYGKMFQWHRIFAEVGFFKYTDAVDYRNYYNIGYGFDLLGKYLIIEVGPSFAIEKINSYSSSFYYRVFAESLCPIVDGIYIGADVEYTHNVWIKNDYRISGSAFGKVYFAKNFAFKMSYGMDYINIPKYDKIDRVLLSSVSFDIR